MNTRDGGLPVNKTAEVAPPIPPERQHEAPPQAPRGKAQEKVTKELQDNDEARLPSELGEGPD
jgi:hypothetical protein